MVIFGNNHFLAFNSHLVVFGNNYCLIASNKRTGLESNLKYKRMGGVYQ